MSISKINGITVQTMSDIVNHTGVHLWNVPIAGFYTYGEFGRAANGKHEFHSTTCCWVA